MENLGTYDGGVSMRKFIFLFVLVCIVVGVGVSYSALSSATITVHTKNATKEFSTEVIVDANEAFPDIDKGILSGEMKFEETGGTKKVKEVLPKRIEEFATGKVTVRNTTPYTQGLREGAPMKVTGISEEIFFKTTLRHTIFPKSTKTIDVVAAQKGAKGNIPPSKFEFTNLTTKYMKANLWAENTERMEGGIREAKLVRQEDLDSEYHKLALELQKRKLDEINSGLEDGRVITKESSRFEFLSRQSDILPGTEADEFEVEAKIKIEGVIINEIDLKTIIKNRIEKLEESDEEFTEFDQDSFTYKLTTLDIDNRRATLKVSMKGKFRSKLSPKVFDREGIVGYNEKALREHFEKYDNITDIDISFWPPFRKTVPNVANRININVAAE